MKFFDEKPMSGVDMIGALAFTYYVSAVATMYFTGHGSPLHSSKDIMIYLTPALFLLVASIAEFGFKSKYVTHRPYVYALGSLLTAIMWSANFI